MSSNGGPVTENGKAVVRWNATQHGISSPEPVIPGVESKDEWQSHRSGMMESLSPAGALEHTLAERAALLSWRLHRVTRYETESISLSQEKVEEEIAERRSFMRSIQGGSIADPVHPEDIRGEAQWSKQRHNALKRFPGLAADKTIREPSDVFHSVFVEAKKRSGMDIEQEIEELPLLGVGEDDAIEELPPMKAADVRNCIEELARVAGLDADDLLEKATWEAGYQARSAAHRLEEVEREIDRRSRERLLPDTRELEKITRYEAHLSRQLYQALHELEALQKLRLTGEDSLLARLEVNGGAPHGGE
jgi:hypothetical protein